MVSDIKGTNARPTPETQLQDNAKRVESAVARASGQTPDAGKAAADSVQISRLPGLIKSTAKSLSQESSVNETRVKELKAAIANGEYPVDANRIAQKILDFDSL